jgi:two-component system NtrC family sensor kinase
MIAGEAERMKTIVGGLLEYARTRPSAPLPGATAREPAPPTCEVAAVVKHVGALLGPQLKKARATFELDVAAPGPVAIEAHALQQVLVNLVQNALQELAAASPPGGPAIAIAARPGPGGVATVIAVSDNGPGIPAADRARVFDPFFTTKAAGAGTGLGLAVCKHLIATAGGTIEAGERPGGGAEFRVVIPNTHARDRP